ncbi:hypothetical protein Hypma_002541 [Hypsizygus marmoreus]|uniref:F-box domain-containing protein n=1 Tax=Hypsizygus marmoreus TaxID=39966 RepID=A0A369JDH9_HYPMA|nr:hypothetical protein Hypma_002541 [Hypsizygus marmoreus]
MPYLSSGRHSLVADVLLYIFCYCDIRSILVLSQSSRHFHDIGFSKQVWLTLLSDLHRHNCIDLLPGQHLNQLLPKELVSLARRTVSGPPSWSDPSGTVVAHQVVLRSSITNPIHTGNRCLDRSTKLLSGGQFVLFQHQGTLECLSTDSGKHIWQYHGPVENVTVKSFAAEVVDEGQAAIIMVGVRTSDHHKQNFVEILRLDLRTGSAKTLIQERTPETSYDNPFSGFKICGDFAIADVKKTDYILIFKLSAGLYKCLTEPLQCHDIDLIPGHLLVLQTVTVESPPIEHAFRFTSLPSPLQEDLSTLWFFFSSTRIDVNWSLSHKYHMTHDRSKGTPLSIDLVAMYATDKTYPPDYFTTDALLNVSYSGHAEYFSRWSLEGRILSFASPDEDDDIPIDLPGRGQSAHLSPYSGALTYATEDDPDEKIFVNHYA